MIPTLTGPFERREDGPWWARVMLWFLMHYGMPSLIAVLLGGLFIYMAMGDVQAIRKDVNETKTAQRTHNEQMVKDSATMQSQMEVQLRVLQAMCYNAAKSDAARNACAGSK